MWYIADTFTSQYGLGNVKKIIAQGASVFQPIKGKSLTSIKSFFYKPKGGKVAKDITEIIVDDEKCNGCGICIEKCMMPVLEIIEGRVKVIDVYLCNECGNCERCCPEKAIEVHGKGIMKPSW